MSARLTFCVDAGGTRCRGRLFERERVLAEAQAGACNPTTDLELSVASLNGLWRACVAAAGRDAAEVDDVVLAIGGAGLLASDIRRRFLAAVPRFGRTEVMTDGYAALIGAGGGRPCALIVAGTGVVAHRLLPDGRSIIRDGWGWIAGDRGSGAWIGQKAMRHALAAVDGIVARDRLATAILATLRERYGEPGNWLVRLGPDRLAGLAPLVVDAAAAGDDVANGLLERAAAHLAALAGSLAADPGEALYLAGGLAPTLRPRVARRLGREVAAPVADAIAGCLLVASGRAPAEHMIDPFAGLADGA